MKDNIVFVLDVDGTLTDGKMYYTEQGKWMKAFGCDDWDALKEVNKFAELCFVTGDKKGFEIVRTRIEKEMNFNLYLVSHKPKERWDWIENKFPNRPIIFMGDGVFDWYSLSKCDYGITTNDALDHVKVKADFITIRSGGNRAVAEACVNIMEKFFEQTTEGLGL